MNGSTLAIMLVSVLRLSVPVVVTGLGNMFCEKVGVMNLGAEGMMIAGAFGAMLGSYYTENAWIGVLCGVAAGMLIAGLHSLISVEFGGVQNISGLGLNTLAAGLTAFFCTSLFGTSLSATVPSLQTTDILGKVPLIGSFLQQFSPLTYLSVLLIAVSWYVIGFSTFGMRMTAVGDDPRTVETAGINVWRLRHTCVLICGMFAGLAGAYLSIGQLNIFMTDMTNGKGMLAVIAVKMGRWQPRRILLVALMFGFFDALQTQLQINNSLGIPPELIQTIPFLVGIAALALDSISGANPVPLAMRQPYLKNRYKF